MSCDVQKMMFCLWGSIFCKMITANFCGLLFGKVLKQEGNAVLFSMSSPQTSFMDSALSSNIFSYVLCPINEGVSCLCVCLGLLLSLSRSPIRSVCPHTYTHTYSLTHKPARTRLLTYLPTDTRQCF